MHIYYIRPEISHESTRLCIAQFVEVLVYISWSFILYCEWILSSADPEILSANVSNIMQRSVNVTWHKGRTQIVNDTVVHYRATNLSSDWNMTSVGDSSSYTVTTLQPGTEYQFFVVIHSYGKTASSQSITFTTGCFKFQIDSEV